MFASVPRTLGAHELKLRLATGGQAEIWLAEARGPGGLSRRVALKVLQPQLRDDPNARRALMAEARLLAQCDHPHLLSMLTFGEDDGFLYIATPLLWGRSLITLMQRARQTPYFGLPEALWIAQALFGALEHLRTLRHPYNGALGVVHHDVTPENIVVTYGGQVKLIDLGIATAAGEWPRTRAGHLQGKLAYMAPEHLQGGRAPDHRSDLYAGGLVLYYLTTGQEALGPDGWNTPRAPHIPSPDQLADIPHDLTRLLQQLLDPDPARRPAQGREVSRRLSAMLHRFAPGYDVFTFTDNILAILEHERLRDDDLLASLNARTDLIPNPDALAASTSAEIVTPERPAPPRHRHPHTTPRMLDEATQADLATLSNGPTTLLEGRVDSTAEEID